VEREPYASFLLRLRLAENNGRPTWVTSLQSTRTGEQRYFANLDARVRFLRSEFSECDDTRTSGPPDTPLGATTR